MCTKEATIQEFVDIVLREFPYGARWLNGHKEAIDQALGQERWKSYSSGPISEGSLTSLLFGISAKVTYEIRDLPDFRQVVAEARRFLHDICLLAKRDYGLEPNPDALDAIIVHRKL